MILKIYNISIWWFEYFDWTSPSMGLTALISSEQVYHQFNTTLKQIVWLIHGYERGAGQKKYKRWKLFRVI